jgi:hypothetical protein
MIGLLKKGLQGHDTHSNETQRIGASLPEILECSHRSHIYNTNIMEYKRHGSQNDIWILCDLTV